MRSFIEENPIKAMTRHCWLAAGALTLVAGTMARAEEGDGLKWIAATSVRHDSNFFRLPSSADTQELIGRSSRAETITTTALGVHYEKSYSLQSVKLDVGAIDYRYHNFGYLDFTALNYSGAWQWSYTPSLYGNVTASREENLNSFSDFQGFGQRNLRVNTENRIDVTYELDARFRLLGALLQSGQTNRQPLIVENGSRTTGLETGLRYVFPSENYLGFKLRKLDGTYTDAPLSTTNEVDNSFTQNEIEAELLWALSIKTTADVKVRHISREHPNFPQRDFNGFGGAARLTWSMSAKTSVTAALTRDLAAYQTADTNFVQVDRFSLGPVWQMGAKTRLSMQLGASVRNYGGSPGISQASNRRDINREAGLTVDWRPRPFVTVIASAQNVQRSSNAPGLDFSTNLLNLSARLSF